MNNTVQKSSKHPSTHGGKSSAVAVGTPFYNMGVTVGDVADAFKYPRGIDNAKTVRTDDGDKIVLHSVPCANEIAQLDWVTFQIGLESFHSKFLHMLPEQRDDAFAELISEFEQDLFDIFGFGIACKRDKGMHFYSHSWELEDKLGMVLCGHANNSISVQLNGTGCALAARGWEQRLYRYLTTFAHRPKLTRVDVAHDDFTGEHLSVDWADQQDSLGGFWCGGRMPCVGHLGNWKRIDGRGRTLTIGRRENGKFLRVYEKGKKEGDSISPWTRAEVEFGASSRFIPFDILLSPTPYFIGAYPAFADFDQYHQPEKIQTIKKVAETTWRKSIDMCNTQIGKYIAAYRHVYSDDEIISMIVTKKQNSYPARLEKTFSLAKAIEREKAASALKYKRNLNFKITADMCDEYTSRKIRLSTN